MDRRLFLGGAGAALASTLPLLSQGTGSSAGSVTVDPQSRLGQLAPLGLGFSTEKHLIGTGDFYVPANSDFTGLCRLLGPQVLRVGGTHVDHTTWSRNGVGHVNGTVAQSDIERFAAYIKSIGWKVVYGVNLAHASAADSADEARCAADYLGDSLLAFEIGNEPDLFVNHKDREQGYTYADFLKEWRAHADALRAAVPGAPLSGPGAFNQWRQYGLPFADDTKGEVNILTQHYYRMSGRKPEATLESLLTGLPMLFEEVSALVQAAAKNKMPGGFRMIETNTFVGGGLDGVSDRSVAALWAVEFALRAAEMGARGLNFQIGPKGHSNSSIAMGPGPSIGEVRPEFYGLTLVANLGTGNMLKTAVQSDSGTVTAFALEDKNGKRNVIVNNFSDNPVAGLAVRLGNTAARAEYMVLDGGSLTSPTCTLGGASISTRGAWQPHWTPLQGSGGNFSVTVPPASSLVIRS